ncbi:MAG TPA: ATP-binding protein [Patescibacteria group bacterium]|nr:ATP-binding protein [Patescibacteria group bacterium]
MKYSLRNRLSISYIIIAMICVTLISIIANLSLESQFRQYVKSNQEKKNENIVSLISQQYHEGEEWNRKVIQDIGINALENGMIISVIDTEGMVLWDATEYNNGMCEQMMIHMNSNMASRYPNWKGEFTTAAYPIISGVKEVGNVEIGYYGPFYFTDADLAFINALNVVFIAVGGLSLVLSLVFGYIMARSISTPISRVIDTAEMISRGRYDGRSNEISNIKEIAQLTGSINNLADTLEKQEKLRKRLTADVAHELRTPLATLQSHIEAMIDGIWEADSKRLKSVHEEIMRLGRMVGDLEKLTRFENERMSLEKAEFDISELIRSIMVNFEKEYADKNIRVFLEDNNINVSADRDKISQVIINLMANALKFTAEGGHIHITICEDTDNAIISISDTGIGIAADDLPHIFERFYRADASRSRHTGGSGIGLTIAKAIIEAHKGTIIAESEIGKGTKFVMTIPKI